MISNNYLNHMDIDEINKTYQLYLIDNNELSKYKYFMIKNTEFDKAQLMNILKQERFI